VISVIIPTYNRASYLSEAITSVLGQDFFSRRDAAHAFELLVIDDGSDDNTREAVASFEGRVSYHAQAHRGVSAARNAGLRLAHGEAIAFLDSDDLWLKQKIGVQMAFFKSFPDAKVCYGEEVWIRNGARLNPHKKHAKPSGWIFDKVLPLCLLSLSSCLFRREVFDAVGDFDESLPVCEDYDLGIRIARRYPIHLIPAPLIIKRGGHADQLSHRYWGMDRYRVLALEKALRAGLEPWQEKLVREEICRKSRVLLQGFERRGKSEEAAVYREIIRKNAPSPSGEGDGV
jgi:glycosyltransferase involved in cell wall biosynthesis